MFRDMCNIVFLAAAEILEFIAVLLSLPAKLVGDIASFCYGASHYFDNNEDSEEQQ